MKAGWERKTLGEICTIQNGSTPAKTNPQFWENGTIPWFTVDDIREQGRIINHTQKSITQMALEQTSVKLLPPDSVLLCCTASVGEHAITRIPLATNQQFNGLVIKDKTIIEPTFLFYFAATLKNVLLNLSGKTTIDFIPISRVRDIAVPLPPLPEQQRIVRILDEAFASLATAKANAEKNLQNARALFESELEAMFRRRSEEWSMVQLGELTTLARGYNPPKSKFSREHKPSYVRFYQIRDGGTDDYTVYVPDTPQLHKVEPDDILMVAYRHIGRVFRGAYGAFNVALCKISNARRDLLDDDYLFHIIPSSYVKGVLLRNSERSLIPSMSIEHLREITIPLPELQEQRQIVERINLLSTETQRLEGIYQRKLAALEELKKALLHQAFSGSL